VEFTFVKMPSKKKIPGEEEDSEEEKEDVDLLDYLEFYCQPSQMKLAAGQ